MSDVFPAAMHQVKRRENVRKPRKKRQKDGSKKSIGVMYKVSENVKTGGT